MKNAEAFIEAVHDLVQTTKLMGLKPPSSINFHTAHTRNAIAEAALAVKQNKGLGAEFVTVTLDDQIEIDGVRLKVSW